MFVTEIDGLTRGQRHLVQTLRIEWYDARGERREIRIKADGDLEIHADEQLIVYPRASNAVVIDTEDF